MSVYDSMAGTASATTQKTVRVLAGKHTRVKYVRTCTQQTKSGDCGCFALAYATTVVLGGSSFYIDNLFLIYQFLYLSQYDRHFVGQDRRSVRS